MTAETTQFGSILMASCFLLAAGAAAQDKAPTHLALLVGIDRYEQPDEGQWHTLRGCENDVKLVREVLLERFGFQDADIVTLTSEKATHAAIVKAFHEHLVRKAGPDTKVVFWFSGHGSQVPDPSQKDRANSGDYEGAKDQTMLAHDSRKGSRNGSYDLADDELHSLLAAVRARDVVFVTDCCHSGGLTRGESHTGVRGEADGDQPVDLEALRKDAAWPADVPLVEDDAEGRILPNVVHVSACSAHEEAGEIETMSRVHGTLTWFLCQTLREVPADTSWRVVVETVRARISGRMGSRPGQHVDVVGDGTRAILGGTGRPVPAGYLVQPDGLGSLRIHAGAVHGIGANTVFQLRDLDGRIAHECKPESVTTSATVLPSPPKALVGKPLWAMPTGELDGRAVLTLGLPDGAKDIDLRGTGFRSTDVDAEYRLRTTAEGFELSTRTGECIGRAADARELAALLFREASFRFLWDAVGTRGEREVEIRAVPPRPEHCFAEGDDGKRLPVPAAAMAAAGRGQRTRCVSRSLLDRVADSGSIALLQVENKSDEDLHIAVLSVQEDRRITPIRGLHENNLLRAGQTMEIPVQVGPSPAWKSDRPMIDRYVVFATPRFVDFRVFATDIEVTRGGSSEEPPNLFALLGAGDRTRGGDGARKPWGVTWIDLELVAPAQKKK